MNIVNLSIWTFLCKLILNLCCALPFPKLCLQLCLYFFWVTKIFSKITYPFESTVRLKNLPAQSSTHVTIPETLNCLLRKTLLYIPVYVTQVQDTDVQDIHVYTILIMSHVQDKLLARAAAIQVQDHILNYLLALGMVADYIFMNTINKYMVCWTATFLNTHVERLPVIDNR